MSSADKFKPATILLLAIISSDVIIMLPLSSFVIQASHTFVELPIWGFRIFSQKLQLLLLLLSELQFELFKINFIQ